MDSTRRRQATCRNVKASEKTQPYATRIAHKGIGVEPKLLAEIEYRARSPDGKVVIRPSGPAGGSLMDAFDRLWQWDKELFDSPPTIPA